jgi:hypothetical protein
MTPLITEMTKYFDDRVLNYKWFDISSLLDLSGNIDREVAYPLMQGNFPFDKCAIAGIDVNGYTFAILTEKVTAEKFAGTRSLKGCIHVKGVVIQEGVAQVYPMMYLDVSDPDPNKAAVMFDKMFLKYYPTFSKELKEDYFNMSMNILATWLVGLNERGNEVYTPSATAKHAKRMRQGKKPLYDWRVVTIEPSKPAAPHQGGTHASPRLHDVRGHWVNRSGKRFWRKAHQRGDASLGIAFHDYKFKEMSHG